MMKKLYLFILVIAIFLSYSSSVAYGEMAPSQLPRNIRIEVEFKETGIKTKRIGGLAPYQTRRTSQYTKQSLTITDGLTGTIRVGEDVPYIEYYTRYLIDHGYVQTLEITFKEIGTKLLVTPKIRGDYIEISLTPQISYMSGCRKDVINIKELTTTVIAMDGQPISIGGLLKDDEFKDYFFKTKTASNLNIILTPHIQ
jgi:hypothetical protein